MNAYNLWARASPTKEALIRSMEDVVQEINRVGEICQIRIHSGKSGEISYYTGLVLKTELKQNYVRIHMVVNGDRKSGRRIVKIPREVYEDEERTEIHSRRLIERTWGEENQFVPVDKKGNLTTNPDRVAMFIKVSLHDIKKMQGVIK